MRLSATKMGVTNQNRSLGNQLWDLAGGRPSLDLPFADNKSLVDATTGANLVDFTRASSGTYVGSDGLIKTTPVNLLTYSEQFDQWTVASNSVVTPNVAVAPDGTNTADQTFTATQTYPKIPQNAKTAAYTLVATDAGKHISITTGGVTVPSGVFAVGDAVSIYNNSGSDQTITQGASVTIRLPGTSLTGNRTLLQYGVCTLLCVSSNVFVISGSGLT
ncbi:hypothetical protein [Synechococcus phage S-B28]|uniref:Uncharacterized protein n=1 Tax=Synechococcus phage S-B28 TaxID=2545435 RepID=A0A482IAL7_9CAUD|nr:hypothetical protein HOV28_gp11 [Synechococcus phage S-B28]QBP05806.1 hypothetical protein [Synechococcus phage S-B28]